MNTDVEMVRWRQQWQSGPGGATHADAAAALRRSVLRDTRRNWLGLIAPILVTAGVGAGIVLRAFRTERLADAVLAVEGLLLIVVVWTGCLWIARGTWRPFADTTAGFVEISIRRCEANLRVAIFGAFLYVIQLLFVLVMMIVSSPLGLIAILSAQPTILFGWIT